MNKTEFLKILAKKMDTFITNANKKLKLVLKAVDEAILQEDTLAFVRFGTFVFLTHSHL